VRALRWGTEKELAMRCHTDDEAARRPGGALGRALYERVEGGGGVGRRGKPAATALKNQVSREVISDGEKKTFSPL
jgi:hypothetical protein